jgi:integrase
MSIHRMVRSDGSVSWQVRWRDGGRGSRARARSFDRRADAVAFEDELRRRKRLGDLVGFAGAQETLNRFVTETWAKSHAVTLAPKTAKHYASLYDLHVEPYLGELKLTELSPEVIGRWQADRLADGAGRVAVLHALELLGSILQRAVEGGRLARNPVRLVRKIARPRRREVKPLAPATVEAMRAGANARDATLISVLAYSGLRPQEALALQWGDVRERTLLIERAVSLGEEKDTKTRAHRTVRLLAPLREDLLAWRLRSGRPGETSLVFPGPAGRLWTKTTYDNWRKRAFDRARAAAEVEGATPYALRHSFASLLLHEGRSVVYVARQLGHDARLTLTTYGHVIDELDEFPRVLAEEAIRAARNTACARGVHGDAADGHAG